jgi:cell division transport system permease protein
MLQAWANHHLYAFFSSLGQLARAPLPSLMTAAVIGIALALPAGLYLLLENAIKISEGWDNSVYMSLFLHNDIHDEQAEILAAELRNHPSISHVRLITRAQALEEYRQLSGFNDAINALDDNPLPTVVVVSPILSGSDTAQALLTELQKLPQVDIAQFDMRWLQRLFAMMDIGRRGVLILALLLSLAVILVIGNTIRLAVQNRQAEIEINKLFGATDSFIRRPFLYTGLWFGLGGGIIAALLVELSLRTLAAPVQQLAALYASEYQLIHLNPHITALMLASSMLLGLLGAWLAVARHLYKIQPR